MKGCDACDGRFKTWAVEMGRVRRRRAKGERVAWPKLDMPKSCAACEALERAAVLRERERRKKERAAAKARGRAKAAYEEAKRARRRAEVRRVLVAQDAIRVTRAHMEPVERRERERVERERLQRERELDALLEGTGF